MDERASKKLVNTLNQIEGITIAAIGEEAIAESTLPYITLHCPIDTAADLLEVVIRCQHLQINIMRDDYSPNMAWCILRPAEMPGRFSSLSEIEAELSKELEQSGLLTQNHEGKNVNQWETYLKPDSEKDCLYMNSEKLQLLKTFARNIWEKRIELFRKEGWEKERLKGFPTVSGNKFSGSFEYENYFKFPAIDVWSIEWQAWRIRISLNLHDYGEIRVKSLQDIENKPFMYDDIIKALLL